MHVCMHVCTCTHGACRILHFAACSKPPQVAKMSMYVPPVESVAPEADSNSPPNADVSHPTGSPRHLATGPHMASSLYGLDECRNAHANKFADAAFATIAHAAFATIAHAAFATIADAAFATIADAAFATSEPSRPCHIWTQQLSPHLAEAALATYCNPILGSTSNLSASVQSK